MKEIYSWVPWFAELCDGIANNGPKFLAERARRIPWKKGSEEPALLRHGDENIDPFSFVYSLAAYNNNEARRRVYPKVSEEFELISDLPVEIDDAFIFPTPPGFALFQAQGDSDLALLWRLFRNAVEGMDAVSGEDFEASQGLTGVAAAKLTQALFLVNGREFLPYDKATQSLRGENAKREHRIGWDDYRTGVAALGDAFPGCMPYEINLLAYETSKNDNPLKLNPANLWQISTRVYGNDDPSDEWDDFERENWAYTGGPGKVSWDDYDPGNDELSYSVGEPSPGDILLVRYGRIGHGIGAIWRNDYAEALTSEARLHVLWLCKEDTQLNGSWWQSKAFTRADKIGATFREAYPQTFSYLDRVAGRSVDTEGSSAPRSGTTPEPRRRFTAPGSLNTILYGPPGTGKTFRTIARSVEICDCSRPEGETVRTRYNELVAAGRIEFVTFHQSFGYEEFVEGIRPVLESGQVVYRVEDGILKRMAKAARNAAGTRTTESNASFETLWGKLLERAQEKPLLRTQTSGEEYRLESGGRGVVLIPVGDGHKRPYSRKRVRKLWDAGLRKDPADTTPTEIQDALGTGTHGSYYWVIYKELWDLNRQIATAGVALDGLANYVLVIDEINRANISKVMGELITLLEEDKRQGAENEVAVTLPYSRERFTLPVNLHILGTMNTADRSIALLDTALRRRFEFEEMAPDSSLLDEAAKRTGVDLPSVLTAINERMEYLVDRDHLLGHAWLMQARDRAHLDTIMRRKVIPLIAEYFYEDWNKVRAVLGGDRRLCRAEQASGTTGPRSGNGRRAIPLGRSPGVWRKRRTKRCSKDPTATQPTE